MPHDTPLISTIVGGLVLAFIFGAFAHRLRMPPLVGYLIAGVLVGPHTPGYVADQSLAPELAEIGVILLMFGVGLHFSLKDLMLPASIEPSALPAPTIVCSSSMNRMTLPSCLARSLSTALSRSSNSPRNFAPAISDPMGFIEVLRGTILFLRGVCSFNVAVVGDGQTRDCNV